MMHGTMNLKLISTMIFVEPLLAFSLWYLDTNRHTSGRNNGRCPHKKVHFYFVKIITTFCCENKIRHVKMCGKM
jgi:hypothetical protein